MVADSKAQMNKFLYRVSNLVKIECRNAMLLGDMSLSRLMTHAQQVEGDKLKEHAKEKKKSRTGIYDYSHQKTGGGNRPQGQQKFSTPAPSSASGQRGNANRAQSTTLVAPTGRPTQQGNTSGTGGRQRQNKLYSLQAF
ncbi:uncharacterized protein LOC125834306 [Solanum verrucosum]|uniref:uncharacterized protein LOC125834306 n=1 Tax=Solanum verrucosum TaxID=315347 RepID=UPI0020D00915|nr:uncharacterized protein LOC125834306 [Solanum verrucosum]